jgi:hypothetical protein
MKGVNMDDSAYQELKEKSWRKPLSPEEQTRLDQILAARPSVRRDWTEEQALDRCLDSLPPAPVSSNFTARVVHAAEHAAPAHRPIFAWNLTGWIRRRWAPTGIAALLMTSLCLVSYHQFQLTHRTRMAHSIETVTRVAALPEMDWLQDFETINRMSQVQVADTELLEVLQ